MFNNVESRYVTGVILANGVEDTHKDVLNKSDIKKIFIKYLKHDTDTMHSYIRNDGVDLLANWITETDREIAGKIAPEGSWLSTFKVTNSEIIKSLDNGDITGLSLGSVPNQVLTQKFWFLNQPMKDINSFKDLDSVDDAQPVFISFVDEPSNGYGLEIERENVYINKRANTEEKNMSDKKEVNEPTEDKLSLSGWMRIAKAFGINKSVATEQKQQEQPLPTDPVKTEPNKEEKNEDISNKELLEKIPDAVANGMVSAFEKMNKNSIGEKSPAKSEEKEEEEEEEEKNIEEPTNNSQPTKTIPKIDKKATIKDEPISQPNTNTTFYAKSGRDEFGCRRRD